MSKIEIGKPWPERSDIARALMSVLAGSSSEDYRQVDWFESGLDPSISKEWPSFSGDKSVPEIFGIPYLRSARRAGIVAVRAEVMDNLRKDTPEYVDAVATVSLGGRPWVGVLPKGVEYGSMEHEGESYEAIAGRIGRGDLRIMPVRVNPADSGIVIPSTEVVRQIGSVEFVPRLPDRYHGVVPVV